MPRAVDNSIGAALVEEITHTLLLCKVWVYAGV